MNTFSVSIKPFGKQAILIEWPNEVNEAILNDILQFEHHLKKNCLDMALWECIPSYNSITLVALKEPIDFKSLERNVFKWYAEIKNVSLAQRYLWRLPVCYDTDFGMDLEEVAGHLGHTIDKIIALHTAQQYTVYGIGFLPGFMYLGGLPKALEISRKETPRLKVPQGAVGLASRQTGIYPQESPGGWNIIGNCPVTIFNVENDPPCFVGMGDKIQFYAISKAEYDLYKIENEVGVFKLEKQELDA
ncbi:5-oxoprolinase subunit PxpB [Spongiimicrobium salis]|uniref:5-oxoprolinase subunit PxpB n=1 Tax=Spongiimicrobium salis TaxID=1667022 RepID=UPI00374CE83A